MTNSNMRLRGGYYGYRQSISDITGSLLSAIDALSEQRRKMIIAFDTLEFKGRLSKKKFDEMMFNLSERGIYLRVRQYPRNRTELYTLRNILTNRYDNKTQFLTDQAIVALAISFEEFVRRMMMKFYTDDPRRISKDKELDIETNVTIGEMTNKIDLESLYKGVAESIVTKLQRESARKWFEIFEKKLKFKFDDPKDETIQKQIIELYLVRNAIVHNAKFITKELVEHNEKFIGLSKIHPSTNDFKRYAKATTNVVNKLVDQYSNLYPSKLEHADTTIKALISLHNNGKALESGVKLNMRRSDLNSLVPRFKNASLLEIRNMIDSNFYDSKILGLKILIDQYKKNVESGLRGKIFAFCLLNFDHFNSWEMINLLTRNILTGPRVVGHNLSLLEAMSSYKSKYRAYFLLRIIHANPNIATRRHLAWIVNNIDKNTISRLKGEDKVKLVTWRNKTRKILLTFPT